MNNKITIHWFRSDLRLENNPSLAHSCLKESSVTMGKSYPYSIVDLSTSRKTTLEAFKTLKNNTSY